MAYRIREWDQRYEVNDKNRALRPGERMRQGELEYLRMPVHGRNHSSAYRRFLREAKDDAPMVYGVYIKLKEIAAQAQAGKRGVIRNDAGEAIDAEEIAECMGFPMKSVKRAIEILCRKNVGWLEEFREFPGNPGISPSESESESESEAESDAREAGGGAGLLTEKRKWVVDQWNVVATDRGWPKCSRIPQGQTGEMLDARCKDGWWVENYPRALEKLLVLKWPDTGGRKGLRISALLRPDAVRAIVDGEWDDKPEERREGGSWELTEAEADLIMSQGVYGQELTPEPDESEKYLEEILAR